MRCLALLSLCLIPMSCLADTGRIAPSFSCPRPAPVDGLSQMICDNAGMSREQAVLAQTYYVLRHATGRAGWKALKLQAAMFDAGLRAACGIPRVGAVDQTMPRNAASCYDSMSERDRYAWLERLTGAAREEATRPIEQHLALQRRLVDLGFLPHDMTVDGIYGEATRIAITTWQRADHRPHVNGFLSDADADELLGALPGPLTPPLQAPPSVQAPRLSSIGAQPDGRILAVLLLFMAIIGGAVGLRRRMARLAHVRRRNRALGLCLGEIALQQRTLQIRKIQLVEIDAYGTVKTAKWVREKEYFCKMRILPLLTDAGLADQWAPISCDVDRRLELAASAPAAVAGLQDRFVSDPRIFDKRMDPIDYERHCALLLRASGWSARVTAASGDQGTDVLARRHGKTLVLQCKLYRQPVGNSAVQEISAARLHQRADFAAVVSNASFTPAARQLARTNGVHLLHHEELRDFDPAAARPPMDMNHV